MIGRPYLDEPVDWVPPEFATLHEKIIAALPNFKANARDAGLVMTSESTKQIKMSWRSSSPVFLNLFEDDTWGILARGADLEEEEHPWKLCGTLDEALGVYYSWHLLYGL